MSLYNLTNYTNPAGMVNLVQTTNNLMDGFFGPLIVLAVFVLVFSAIQWRTAEAKISFSASSFISLLLILFFRSMQIVPDFLVFIGILFVAISIVILIMGKNY